MAFGGVMSNVGWIGMRWNGVGWAGAIVRDDKKLRSI